MLPSSFVFSGILKSLARKPSINDRKIETLRKFCCIFKKARFSQLTEKLVGCGKNEYNTTTGLNPSGAGILCLEVLRYYIIIIILLYVPAPHRLTLLTAINELPLSRQPDWLT